MLGKIDACIGGQTVRSKVRKWFLTHFVKVLTSFPIIRIFDEMQLKSFANFPSLPFDKPFNIMSDIMPTIVDFWLVCYVEKFHAMNIYHHGNFVISLEKNQKVLNFRAKLME